MTVVNPKSISGITSITTASGSDNLLTIHTSDANNTERFRIDSTGATKIVTGIVTNLTANAVNIGIDTGVYGEDLVVTGNTRVTGITTFGDSDIPAFMLNIDATSSFPAISIPDSIIHSGDTDTKIRFPDADTITAETGGTERLRINSAGLVGIGTITPNAVLHVEKDGTSQVLARFESNMGTNENRALTLTSPTSDSLTLPFTFSTGNSIEFKCDAHIVHIDPDGRLGIGTNSLDEDLVIHDVSPSIKLTSTSTVGNTNIYFGDMDSSTQGRIQYHNNGDFFRFYTNGNNEQLRITSDGKIGINVDAPDAKLEVRDSASTGIIIRSTQTQSTDVNKAIRVRNNSDTDTFAVSHRGKVFPLDNIVMASGKGIDFGATGDSGGSMSSEVLDDYEEGTFTPSWGGASIFGTTSYSTNQASYKKVGRLVYVSGYTEITGNTGGSGAWFCNNLPFNGDNGTYYVAPGSCMLHNFNLPDTALWVVTYKNSNTNDMSLYYSRDNAAWAQLQVSQDTAFRVIFSLTYHSAS